MSSLMQALFGKCCHLLVSDCNKCGIWQARNLLLPFTDGKCCWSKFLDWHDIVIWPPIINMWLYVYDLYRCLWSCGVYEHISLSVHFFLVVKRISIATDPLHTIWSGPVQETHLLPQAVGHELWLYNKRIIILGFHFRSHLPFTDCYCSYSLNFLYARQTWTRQVLKPCSGGLDAFDTGELTRTEASLPLFFIILEQLLPPFLLFSFHGPLAASKGNILSLSHYAMGCRLNNFRRGH